jgi:transposase
MGKRGPQSFTEEFRREAVRLATEGERSVPAIAAELGISGTTLRNWIKARPKPALTSRGQVLSLEEDNRRLRRENERLREEREILKKATAFFAKGAR